MGNSNLKDKLSQLIDDPLKGTIRKSKNAILTDLRSRLESIERINRYKVTKAAENNRSFPIQEEAISQFKGVLRDEFYNSTEQVSKQQIDIQSLASVGQLLEGEDEGFCLWESKFSLEHSHGELLLSSIKRLSAASFSFIGNASIYKGFKPENTLFIDTETTGLTGGTGTFAFLVGIGYFDSDSFKVRQYFMRDYSEEAAALTSIIRFASRFSHLITFNGRGYDIPILQARMILNKLNFDFSGLAHIDLLFPARMIFKHRLDDCRLSSLEKFVIKFFREDDVRSEDIPYLYFRYLRSKNPALMDKVFYHNAMDIVSLAVLATKIAEMIEMEESTFEYGEDIYGVAHFYFLTGQYEKAEHFFKKAMDFTLPYLLRLRLLTELSLIFKRTRRINEASEIWLGMVEGQCEFDLFPYEELAKYYEHYKKTFTSAVTIVTEAIKKLDEFQNNIESRLFREHQRNLLHRLNRLERKLSGKNWS